MRYRSHNVTLNGTQGRRAHLLPALFLLAFLILMPAAAAVTLSFNDKTLSGSSDLLVYDGTGALINSTWNTTTSEIVLDGNGSYYFILEPAKSQLLDDPFNLLDTLIQYARNNALAILILIILLVVVFRRR